MKKATAFATLSLMHKALLAGQIIFSVVMFILVQQKIFEPVLTKHEKIMQVIALIFAALSLFIGASFFKKKLALINDNMVIDAKAKLSQYQSASLVQWSLLEAAILVCGISYLLAGNYAFLVLAAVLILYFAMLIPVKTKIAAQLNLQTSELDEL